MQEFINYANVATIKIGHNICLAKTELIMKKWFLALASLTLFLTLSADASDPEYQKWLKQYKKEFKTFVDEHDKEFANFLKNNWVETEVKPEQKRDTAPKPKQLPKAKPEPIKEINPVPVVLPKLPDFKPLPVVTPETPNANKEKPQPTKPSVTKPVVIPAEKVIDPFEYQRGGVKVSMLGQTLTMPKLNFASVPLATFSSSDIADAWIVMAKTKFKQPVAALKKASKDLNVDDWGQALLTYQYIEQTSNLSLQEKRLYAWFLLVKQGFDTRIAFDKQSLYLMLHVKQKLFGQKYFTLSDKRFYFVDLGKKRPISVGAVYTYNKQHSSAKKPMAIDLSTPPNHGQNDKKRQLTTVINGNKVEVTTPYNSAYIEYLDHYPQLDMKHYFVADLPQSTKQSLLSQIRPQLEGKSEVQALNWLLRFVQTSLEYQTDQQQFNYENYLFAGETLNYPYADCEDRAVLYAYLVKQLLGNDVIGLQYNGHIATAVAVNSKIDGDSYRVNGKNFVVADPTFINANIGKTMTGYKNQTPKFVMF